MAICLYEAYYLLLGTFSLKVFGYPGRRALAQPKSQARDLFLIRSNVLVQKRWKICHSQNYQQHCQNNKGANDYWNEMSSFQYQHRILDCGLDKFVAKLKIWIFKEIFGDFFFAQLKKFQSQIFKMLESSAGLDAKNAE